MSIAMLDEEKLQKLFYFSLKKTGNPHEAEELVQETALEMIKMLNKGYKPDNFNAWMWTVVKKRFARWCRKKHIQLSKYEVDELSGFSEIASDECIEDHILQNEDIELLRRELALMTKDYREIIVAYYFDNKKINAISKTTALPEGSVKRKLHEARKNIKEGMKMARTNGQRSFAPEEIDFSYNINKSSEGYPFGKPWSLLKGLAAKNIVLEAYNNPSTIEELSLALGIASPYIEDELKEMLETEIMIKRKNGKLETNFVIFDVETQKRVTEISEETGKKINSLICGIIEKNIDKIRKIGFINHDMPKEYLYWCLLYITLEKLLSRIIDGMKIEDFCTKRSNGDEWDITAFEIWDPPAANASLCNRINDGNMFFDHYKIEVADINTSDGVYAMTVNQLFLLTDIIKNSRKKSSFDESENIIVNELAKNHVLSITDNSIKINFPVFNESEKHEFSDYHDIVREIYEGEVYNEMVNAYNAAREAISASLPERFKDNHVISREVISFFYNFRCILLRYAYEKNIIKTPSGNNKSAVTMYMKY